MHTDPGEGIPAPPQQSGTAAAPRLSWQRAFAIVDTLRVVLADPLRLRPAALVAHPGIGGAQRALPQRCVAAVQRVVPARLVGANTVPRGILAAVTSHTPCV